MPEKNCKNLEEHYERNRINVVHDERPPLRKPEGSNLLLWAALIFSALIVAGLLYQSIRTGVW